MNGTRIELNNESDVINMKPGEYGKLGERWYAQPPWDNFDPENPPAPACLDKHAVREYWDKTVTVTPSILVTNHLGTWHGYLTAGEWKSC